MSTLPSSRPELLRDLGVSQATAVVVGTLIGSGIFLVPAEMMQAVGSAQMVYLVWIVGGILSFFGALTYAELGAMKPSAGGEYIYVRDGYGPLMGFLYAWTTFLISKPASIATITTGLVRILGTFSLFTFLRESAITLPFAISWGTLLAITATVAISFLNYLGVKKAGEFQLIFTWLKVLMILGIVFAGFTYAQGGWANFSTTFAGAKGGIAGFMAALVAALWAYDGWNNAGMLGSEILRPERNLPRALILGTASVMGIYLLTNLAYFYVLSGPQVGASARVAADVMRAAVGPVGGSLVSVAAMISIFAALNGSILSGSRVPYAMARDGYFFARIGRVHPRFHTPGPAILLLGGWSSVLLLSGQFKELYTLVIFPSWILYGMTAAAVVVLRRSRPGMPRPYRVLGYPLVPALFVLVALALLYSTLLESPRESGIGLVLIVAGLPFYYHWKRTRG